jgi:transcriptional regulator with XRE-family HTH domain
MENVIKKANFADRFRELYNSSMQNELSELLGEDETHKITSNTFRQWTNGYATPTVKKLIKLSEYFGVSTDYLLGLTDIKSPDVEEREFGERYGLCNEALNALSDMPNSEWSDDMEYDTASDRCGDTMEFRNVINLLLSEERGKEALRVLHSYFFSQLKLTPKAPPFSSELQIDGNRNFTRIYHVDESILRKYLLDCATVELNKLWFDRNNENEKQ